MPKRTQRQTHAQLNNKWQKYIKVAIHAYYLVVGCKIYGENNRIEITARLDAPRSPRNIYNIISSLTSTYKAEWKNK